MICHDTLRLTADRHPYVAWMDSPPVSRVRQSLYIVAGCTSTTRAFNLYRQAGVALDVFTAWLGEARAITQEQTVAIRTRVDDGTTAFPRNNKMVRPAKASGDAIGRYHRPRCPRPFPWQQARSVMPRVAEGVFRRPQMLPNGVPRSLGRAHSRPVSLSGVRSRPCCRWARSVTSASFASCFVAQVLVVRLGLPSAFAKDTAAIHLSRFL